MVKSVKQKPGTTQDKKRVAPASLKTPSQVATVKAKPTATQNKKIVAASKSAAPRIVTAPRKTAATKKVTATPIAIPKATPRAAKDTSPKPNSPQVGIKSAGIKNIESKGVGSKKVSAKAPAPKKARASQVIEAPQKVGRKTAPQQVVTKQVASQKVTTQKVAAQAAKVSARTKPVTVQAPPVATKTKQLTAKTTKPVAGAKQVASPTKSATTKVTKPTAAKPAVAKVAAAKPAAKKITAAKPANNKQVAAPPTKTVQTPLTRGQNKTSRSEAFLKRGRYPKSISRIETKKHSAWYVRIYFEGTFARKTFSDTVWGGKRNAFREALQWRDDMEKRMGKPRTDRSVRKKTVVDNKDVGIYRRHRKEIKRGITYYRDVYEVAISAAPGKVWRTTVSINKHGEKEALRMARIIRREKEQEYFGGVIY